MAMAMSSSGSYDAFLSQQQNQWMQPPQQQNSWMQPQQQSPWMQSQQQTPWIQPQQECADVGALTIRDPPSLTHRVASKVVATYNYTLDSLAPYTGKRWFMAAWMLFCYAWRIYAVGGFYLVSYGFFIHFIFLFIDFLAPKNDPEIEAEDVSDADDESGALPVTHHDDYRPFIRRLPEYSFWLGTCKASMLAFIMTFLPFLDIPVFWPILAVYAVFLAYLLLKERVMHMIKYKYVPFSLSKPTYGAGGKVRKTIGIYSK